MADELPEVNPFNAVYQADEVSGVGQPNFLADTLSNVPSSAYQFGSDVAQVVTNPVQTLDAIGNLGLGLIALAIPDAYQEEKLDKPQEAAMAVGQYISDRYGSVDKAKEALRTDPVGVLADVSGILLGGGYLATKAGLKAGQVATKAGIAIDPLVIAGKGVSEVGKGITRRDVLKGAGAGLASLAVPMSMMTDVTKAIPPVAKSSGILAGIGKFKGIMNNLEPHLSGSLVRENLLKKLQDVYASGRNYKGDYNLITGKPVKQKRNDEIERFDSDSDAFQDFNDEFVNIGVNRTGFSSLQNNNPKGMKRILDLQEKFGLNEVEFSKINLNRIDDLTESRLAKGEGYNIDILGEIKPKVIQSALETKNISKQLDNAPDKQVDIKVQKDGATVSRELTGRTLILETTTGTVEGVPIYRIRIKDKNWKKEDSQGNIGSDVPYQDSIFIPNEAGLAKLAKAKPKLAKGGSVDKALYTDQKYI